MPTLRKSGAFLFRQLATYGWFVQLLSIMVTRDVLVENKLRDLKKVQLLCLMPNRFLGDLAALESTGKYQALWMSNDWMSRFYKVYYGSASRHVFKDWDDQTIQADQADYRSFLRRFLPKLFHRLGVKLVIGSGFHYALTIDWGAVSGESGAPYIVFHRESYAGSGAQIERLTSLGESGRRFAGDVLVLHSSEHRKVLVDSGFVSKDVCVALGTMRMDGFLRDLEKKKQSNYVNGREDCLTFFSFGISPGFMLGGMGFLGDLEIPKPPLWPSKNPENYFYNTCRKTHIAVARFAVENPDVNVIIKAKWEGPWKRGVEGFLQSEGISLNAIPNLEFSAVLDTHELIHKSRVFVGYGSTAVLEAAVSGKPVIVPQFDEIVYEKFKKIILLPDVMDCFNIATSGEDLYEEAAAGIRELCIIHGRISNKKKYRVVRSDSHSKSGS